MSLWQLSNFMHVAVFPSRFMFLVLVLSCLRAASVPLDLAEFLPVWLVDSPWLDEPVAWRLQRWYLTGSFRGHSGVRVTSPRVCYFALRIVRPEVGEDNLFAR